MRDGAHSILAATARFYAPLIVLFALTLLMARPPGAGVGFLAGLAFTLALLAHALVFGVAAARAAAPPFFMRLLISAGLGAALTPIWASHAPLALEISEAGLFLVTAAGGSLLITVFFGRAPTMRNQAP